MVLVFILVVLLNEAAHETAGAAAFRDITRCKYFAKEIQTKGQTLASEGVYKYNTKIEAYCVPQFLSKETKIRD